MSDELPRGRSLDSLKKEAKRWIAALRAGDATARARLQRAIGDAPVQPSLRSVQHALARESGFAGWAELKARLAANHATSESLGRYEAMADALLEAYRTGAPEAMERHWSHTWHRRAWKAMRTYVQVDLGKPAADDIDITLDDARRLVARDNGFDDWTGLVAFVRATSPDAVLAAKPVRVRFAAAADGTERSDSSRDWNAVIRALGMPDATGLEAAGQVTDDILKDVTRIGSITSLDLAGSSGVSDEGALLLRRLPALRHLDLSGTSITDRALDVLRDLPSLESIHLGMTRITDAGAAHLAHCENLERVNLSWTHTGDGAIRALAGKRQLRHLFTGNHVTDAGLPLLHELPVFRTWEGREPQVALMRYDGEPNQLVLRGALSDRGMSALRGLDGLFGLNLDDSALGLTANAIVPLIDLPQLGLLAFDAKDDAMPLIARLPKLRFLGCQDTTAGDDGFEALSHSRSLELIWGRRCHNLQRRGFVALSRMPALRGLSVSCLNVDDAGISSLPDFPALRELMPMDIPDAGYRHIGRCADLESLILMYCRDTSDAATEHIIGLRKLASYFASYTQITDRTPALLAGIDSLERVTFDGCAGLTNAGIGALARLPRLRELRVSGIGITAAVAAAFPAGMKVHWSP